MNVLEVLEKKFTSGNDVPVSRATITREEYEAILELVIISKREWRHIVPKDELSVYENGVGVLKENTDLSEALDAYAKKNQVSDKGVWFHVEQQGNTITYSVNDNVILVKLANNS